MKIYTKKGDSGKTSLIGGDRVLKHHIRIEAYGTVDELNSHIGLIRDQDIATEIKSNLIKVQNHLFTVGAQLASAKDSKMKIPMIQEGDITFLEVQIDAMDQELEAMRNFVLPGGHPAVSFCHIARCVCRRAERLSVHIAQEEEVDPLIIQYLNRLSDYLFTLARKLTKFFDAEEIPWKGNS